MSTPTSSPPEPPERPLVTEGVAGLQPPPPVADHRREHMSRRMDTIILLIVATALFLTAFVVVVGGLVCIIDTPSYAFSEYVADLRQMSSWVLVAAIVVAAKLMAPFVRITRRD